MKSHTSFKVFLSLLYFLSILSGLTDCQSINSCTVPGVRNDKFIYYEGIQPSDKLSAYPEKYVVKSTVVGINQCYALCSINCSCGFVAFKYPDVCVMYDISSFVYFEHSSSTAVKFFYKNS